MATHPLKLIHCKWSGEGTWIPFGDRRPDVGYENHTSHPAPGQLIIYTGDLSECEILLAYGACDFSSKLGQLAGNHFATVVSGNGSPAPPARSARSVGGRPGHRDHRRGRLTDLVVRGGTVVTAEALVRR